LKALNRRYIAAMPVNGEALAPMHSMAASPPWRQESSAIPAKVGAAARHSLSATPRVVVFSGVALPVLVWMLLIVLLLDGRDLSALVFLDPADGGGEVAA
jgi:hypothetical protein